MKKTVIAGAPAGVHPAAHRSALPLSTGPEEPLQPLWPLLDQVRACTACAAHLPLGPRPIFQLHPHARILLVGQAPGRRAHASGLPFDDASGDRLRGWLGVSRGTFYDAQQIAILPMGLCFPGSARTGDLPPRPECAPLWRQPLLAGLQHLRLTVVIGQHARAHHLPGARGTLTQVVEQWRSHLPALCPVPHPSPRNGLWFRRNPWFEQELVPALEQQVALVLRG